MIDSINNSYKYNSSLIKHIKPSAMIGEPIRLKGFVPIAHSQHYNHHIQLRGDALLI
ncbi:hypothetical protein NIES4074_00120 [Cylindrospermum sp. NIES-4074]|nr:hypothetical protein NIES4074_00120 [Cylindrospermum sp. NIES-4074]